jgi:hypothetical protein
LGIGIKELDTVVFMRDVPEHGLKRGDVFAVVMLHGDVALEVEFVGASGHTQAVVTLRLNSVRPGGPRDLLAVREVDAA